MNSVEDGLIPRILRHEIGAWDDFLVRFAPRLIQVLDQFDPAPLPNSQRGIQRLAGFLHELTRNNFELLGRFDGSSGLDAWLIGLAHRYIRARVSQQSQGGYLLEQDQLRRLVRETPSILDDLPPAQSQVLALKLIDGLSHLEISARLKIPTDRVPKLVHRGLDALSLKLQQSPTKGIGE
jgi:hypothetical protein